jgi:hypothetical protein
MGDEEEAIDWPELGDAELDSTPEPPGDLTVEEAVGWRHGYLHAQWELRDGMRKLTDVLGGPW